MGKHLKEWMFRHHRLLTPEELEGRQKELRDYLVEEHPEVAKMSQKEFTSYINRYFASEELRRRKKMAEHLEVFSDAVIAIIITIMVLELPLPSSGAGLGHFLSAVVIFLISFIVIANFWMMHHDIFSRVKHGINEKIVVVDFIFMAELSLIPVLTKWMMVNHSNIPVMLYGVVYMLSTVTLTCLSIYLNREQFKMYPLMSSRQHRLDQWRLLVMIPINLIYITLAYWFPKEIFLLYVILPMISFLSRLFNDDDTQWIEKQVASMPNTSTVASHLVDQISDKVELSIDQVLEDKLSDQLQEVVQDQIASHVEDVVDQKVDDAVNQKMEHH